ncbi:MAG: hypothetical protein JSR99_10405 [Proteobacteria bacterium]|nr:hypothetical protein [Pseudomonadota bacterium]
MKLVTTAALLGASMLAFTATTASADIVCNSDGDCWHAREHYRYEPGLHLRVHPDSWKWHHADHYRWREHAGRGYWRGGVWVDL